MTRILTMTCILALMASAIPAAADPPPWAPAHGRRAKDAQRERQDARDVYRDERRDPVIIERETVIYRANDGHYYCRRSDGTTGLIVGAAVGGLIGNSLARGKSATMGTLLGAGAGALIGQQIDKGSVHCQ